MATEAESYLTTIFSVAKFTLASSTPASFLVSFSTVWTHEAQVIPSILKVFSSLSVSALYPALSTASAISSMYNTSSSTLIFNLSVAKLTFASSTPVSFLVSFSNDCTHDAQVIPSILYVLVVMYIQLIVIPSAGLYNQPIQGQP